jgi:hypothetical protein
VKLLRVPLRTWLVVGTVATFVLGVTLLVLAYLGCTFGLGTHDKSTLVTVALTADALFFGFVAAVLALAAYWAASGQPRLHVDLQMKYSEDNQPVLLLDESKDYAWTYIDAEPEFRARLVVRNTSDYAARNPTVVVKLRGVALLVNAPGWEIVRRANAGGVAELLWDGGADRMIHGRGVRTLPSLTFNGALILPEARRVELEATLFADGIKPTSVTIPFEVMAHKYWAAHLQKMKDRRGGALPPWADASI